MRISRIYMAALFAAAVSTRARGANLDATIRAEMAKQHIPGASVAVLRGDKTVLLRGYGFSDVEDRSPARPGTLFELGSITKQFTATAVMMLVEQGNVGLDKAISTYLPDLPEAWRALTVRRLLTHTSGVPNYTAQPGFTWEKAYTPEEIIALVAGKPMDFAPGARWEYSNTNYYLLGSMVENVSGRTLGAFLSDRIFKPAGMTHTRLADDSEIISNRARGYSWDGRLRNAPLLRRGAAGGAGAILSTAEDMVKWARVLNEQRLLKPASYAEIQAPARLNNGEQANYGFGWAIGKRNGHRVFDHSGGTAGFSTMISRFPDDKLTVIVLTNQSGGGGSAGAVAERVAAEFAPALARKPLKAATTDPDPKATARIKSVVLSILSDKPDLSPFTEEMKKVLSPEMLSSVRGQVTAMGPLRSFAFVSGQALPSGHSYVYSAVFGSTPLVIHATIGADGRIAGLMAGPE